MARIPLFFQQTFATQLFGALHDPDAEAIVEKSKASAALKMASILGSPGSLGSFGASDFADTVGFGVARKRPEGAEAPERAEKEVDTGPANKGIGSADRPGGSKPRRIKVTEKAGKK